MTPRARRLKRKYGITVKQYQMLLRFQNGRCAICQRPPRGRRLAVDHDHSLKGVDSVRGLLCYGCNRFRVSKNTLTSARAVVQYLWRFEVQHEPQWRMVG
jgi:hypothetical protein